MKGFQLWYHKKFKKDKLLRIHLFMNNKRIVTHYMIYKNDTLIIKYRGEAYKLEPSKIYFQDGFATTVFHENEPFAFDIAKGTNKSEISSADLYTGLEEHITRKIIAGAQAQDTFKNILLFGAIGLVAVMGIGFYYLNEQITVINQTLLSYDEIMEALRQSLLKGDNGGIGGFE